MSHPMRSRLLLAFVLLATTCLVGYALSVSWQLAAVRTRGLVLERTYDADRFAALAGGDQTALDDAARNYRDHTGNAVLVVDDQGRIRVDTGIDAQDPAVAAAVSGARHYRTPPLPPVLYPWSGPVVLVTVPAGRSPDDGGAVVVAASTAATRSEIEDAWIQIFCGTASSVLLFGCLAMAMGRWIMRPVTDLLHDVDSLTIALLGRDRGSSPGSAGERRGPEEIQELAEAIAILRQAVGTQAATERRQIADAAHSMRNPLSAMAIRLEDLRSALVDESAERTVTGIFAEVDRLMALLDSLLTHAATDTGVRDRPDPAAVESCDALAVATQRVEAWYQAFGRAGMTVSVDGFGDPAVVGVPARVLEQILDVALSNSSRYAGRGAHAQVTVSHEAESVVVVVGDTGVGVPDEELDRLTDRFFRGSKAAPGGTGLGLPIAATLVTQYGGLFFVDSARPHGFVVTVQFPVGVATAADR